MFRFIVIITSTAMLILNLYSYVFNPTNQNQLLNLSGKKLPRLFYLKNNYVTIVKILK